MKEKIKEIVDHYGVDMQKFVACEELGELIQEISKSVRQGNQYDRKKIIGEIADVKIVLEELMYIFDIGFFEMTDSMLYKLNRQMERIRNEGQHDN